MTKDSGNVQVQSSVDPVTGRGVKFLACDATRDYVHSYYDVPPWSPDGKHIVCASRRPGESTADILVFNGEGEDPRRIAKVSHFNLHGAGGQKWADNRHVVFPSVHNGEQGMTVVDIDSLREEFIRLPGQINKLSPDGKLGVVIDRFAEAGLVDMQTHEYTRICTLDQVRSQSPFRHLAEGQRSHLQNPRWSPDGRLLMLVHRTTEPEGWDEPGGGPDLVEIWVYEVSTGRLWHGARISHHPGWHPNGEDILYVARDPETRVQDLRLVRYDGGNQRVIFGAEHLPAGHPSFPPGRTDLLATDCFGGRFGYGIVLIRLSPQELVHLVTIPFGEDPAVSPAAHAADPPCWHTWTYPRGKSHPHPAWRPDGTRLLYNDSTNGTVRLALLDVSDLVN